ncbi:MAG: terminase family protein [Patescibacteria group bacterium]|nr:terminase family protein [Patescibacteria group bacterium]
MVSVHFPPFFLGVHPDKSVMQTSYSDELASGFGRQARNIVASLEYQHIFQTTLAEDSHSKSTWNTNGRGQYNAMGIGGSATGKGADLLIIDDPIKNRKEADSDLVRNNLWSWYRSTARTRLSPDAAIIICLTRWHDDDMAGRIMQSENASDWEVLKLPAIAEENEKHRKKGEALWPQQYPLGNLMKTKADLGSYEFSALYQQNPISREDQEFRQEMFRPVYKSELVDKNLSCYITIDPAVKESDIADYTGIIINRISEDGTWNIEAERKKIDSAKLIDYIFEMWKREKPNAIGIEETTYYNAIDPFLRKQMVERNIFPIIYALKHHGTKKELRIRGLLPRYEAKAIRHISGTCYDLEEELLRFPKGRNDDLIDALAYQDQIAQSPKKITGREAEVRQELTMDPRTGYLK